MKFFIDTSIFVDVLRTEFKPSSKRFLESIEKENKGFSSVITTAELSVGAYRSNREDSIRRTLDLLSIVDLVDVNEVIALESGKIFADLMDKGKIIELNDSIIAASSLSLGIKRIITRNIEHFHRIKGVEAIEPEELGF
ncbi:MULTISPECIES: type II toxin-antitoxin system VapC family toxin [Methanobacterium]|jgi:tRNA(fMet)-specific endonuclease VapC|uniref:type II toxin-antitoxin system VapC family toxin n=1 Tax=Methanobacterium TaxID=2160 RepID=UPI0007474FA3|nr:type II toxin-antitoxin system VapC family toxin [Methanobacterium sp. 42_16]KUK72338.1 MAG: Pin protein [Methanobacterium sp. 42_16]